MTKKELRRQLEEIMPPVFVRKQVPALTGGMLNDRTLANLDSFGRGPKKAFVKMGPTRVGYLRDPFLDWFLARLDLPEGEEV